jgi:hypothetical protein
MSPNNAYLPRRLVIEIEDAVMDDMNQISILIGERDIADSSGGHDGYERESDREILSINTTNHISYDSRWRRSHFLNCQNIF